MIKQPDNSKLCGQCYLATILNKSLDEAIILVGHKNGTSTKELARHFKNAGLKRGVPSQYSLCRVHFDNYKNTHWVLFNEDWVYEPAIGEYIQYEDWRKIGQCRITSYVEIL